MSFPVIIERMLPSFTSNGVEYIAAKKKKKGDAHEIMRFPDREHFCFADFILIQWEMCKAKAS